MSISKRSRFEIFKRDSFTCQYCGKKPPQAILEVDHILPRCEGGSNLKSNLVTACFDCNRGKAGITLDNYSEPLSAVIQKEKEREEQLSKYNNWLKKLAKKRDDEVKDISVAFMRECGSDPLKYSMHEEIENRVRYFMDRLPSEQVKQAIIITQRNKPNVSRYTFIKYFCGVCWRKIKGGEA